MSDNSRLIEHAFPLKQASIDSVHEKNVRHGHISTLHIWPARRPLAACRAALIATLLPDPGTPEKRRELCEKIGGKLVKKTEKKKMPNGQIVEREKEVTEGGILHWGLETENKELLDWFREEIKKAYGGRAPKVLDPFAGGGAIPLEAMRLGCEVTAVDINPVAWFILKCTLEYPQKLAGKILPLPDFILSNEEFMGAFYKAHPHLVGFTKPTKKQLKEQEATLWQSHCDDNELAPEADLAWHVRAWGYWVLDKARRELAKYYPTYAEFEPIDRINSGTYETQPIQLVPLKEDGTADIDSLNKDFSKDYLDNKKNPRWIAKPTVAYLWARTVTCKNCRATIPLLKTRWLCKKDRKRVVLTMEPNEEKTGVIFGIDPNVPVNGGNAAQKREHDKRIGSGTMSRSGAKCPCCSAIMTMEDIRFEGQAGRLGAVMTAVVVDTQKGKEYRLPTSHELQMAKETEQSLQEVFTEIPFGLPKDPLPGKEALGFRIPLYGFDLWNKMFSDRQLLALGTFLKYSRTVREVMQNYGYSAIWEESIIAYLVSMFDRLANQSSNLSRWNQGGEKIEGTFARFALPILWDYAECNPLGETSGGYPSAFGWVTLVVDHLMKAAANCPEPTIICQSAIKVTSNSMDCIITDPPYYDAIPYSDLMDYYYVWLRRILNGLTQDIDDAFPHRLSPKWNESENDGELIDDASRHSGDKSRSKDVYEDGMARVFQSCYNALRHDGKFVVVFAHKHPDAWETLVSAIIRSGFVVDGSWPIQTEMGTRTRALSSSALSSSVWLVCKKRPETARVGWDAKVLADMRQRIKVCLREFWDAGIRGPDFVWAATGPALEAYSKYPVVKKANEPGQIMSVNEFLNHVRRMVVNFVIGRVLSGDKDGDAELASADCLDEPTAYYLLHRHDFGLDEAPAGACILYAISCGLSDRELATTWNILAFTKGKSVDEEQEEADVDAEADLDSDEDSGSKLKLKTWAQRKGKSLGYNAPGNKPIPLIDQVHCLMHLWKGGDLYKVDEYIDNNALRRQELFKRLLQSLIELSPHGSTERALLESLSNHVQARGAVRDDQTTIPFEIPE
ncbi:MAG: DUF1156 domain-containing protein [Nitrospirae bacterium]|nr:DUF1156 domain-containing protein [Nitrospirota bacterium]